MKPSRRNPPLNKTDTNRNNLDHQKTQNQNPQDSQDVPTMQMDLTREINNTNNAMNDMSNTMNESKFYLQKSFANASNTIASM